jgi:hypothetical protein
MPLLTELKHFAVAYYKYVAPNGAADPHHTGIMCPAIEQTYILSATNLSGYKNTVRGAFLNPPRLRDQRGQGEWFWRGPRGISLHRPTDKGGFGVVLGLAFRWIGVFSPWIIA